MALFKLRETLCEGLEAEDINMGKLKKGLSAQCCQKSIFSNFIVSYETFTWSRVCLHRQFLKSYPILPIRTKREK